MTMPLNETTGSSDDEHRKPQLHRALRRSPYGVIAGVCAGLSDFFGLNLIFIRCAFVALATYNGVGAILYLILVLVIPATPVEEAHAAGLASPPKNPRRTFFGYIAVLGSLIGGAVAFGNNSLDLYKKLAEVLGFQVGHFEPWVQPVPQPVARLGVLGVARLKWDAPGGTHNAYIEMSGESGFALVNAPAPAPGGKQRVVHQGLSVQYTHDGVRLVGREPDKPNYNPDTFRLGIQNGKLRIIYACDDQSACTPVQNIQEELQFSNSGPSR